MARPPATCARFGIARSTFNRWKRRYDPADPRWQVAGGSEVKAGFEVAGAGRGVAPSRLPPRSPKLNGRVERLNRTFREEFWERHDGPLELPPLPAALREAERAHHAVQPHQALGYRAALAPLAALGDPHL